MYYAIVTEYTDGRTTTQIIDNKAPTATKITAHISRFVDRKAIYITYITAYHPERKIHMAFEYEDIKIPVEGVKQCRLHNVTENNGTFTVDPRSCFCPIYPW